MHVLALRLLRERPLRQYSVFVSFLRVPLDACFDNVLIVVDMVFDVCFRSVACLAFNLLMACACPPLFVCCPSFHVQ